MTGIELGLLLIAWAAAGGSPGPATLAISSTAMDRGRRAGLMVALGILAGSASWGIAAALGMSALMVGNACIMGMLRYFGAAYLLYLAIKSLRSAMRPKLMQSAPPVSTPLRNLFLKGLLIHLTNPKAILGWGAVYAIVLGPGAQMTDVFRLFGALISVSTVVFLGYGLLFSTPSVVRGYQRLRRWFELLFAALFGGASLKILTAGLE